MRSPVSAILFRAGFCLVLGGNMAAAEPKGRTGGLVIAFDDGDANWLEIVAPVLKEHGGKATAFINNQYIPTRLSWDQLRQLRDDFNWEIASHGYHHTDARTYARRQGLEAWERDQLLRSLDEFREHGFEIRHFAFPYNAFDDRLANVVRKHLASYRHVQPLALVRETPGDGAHPATSLDLAAHVPTALLESWVSTAALHQATLFFYAHRVLPDSHFHHGTVLQVGDGHLIIDTELPTLPETDALLLVPNPHRRLPRAGALPVRGIHGTTLHVQARNLHEQIQPGDRFRIGPAQTTPLSDFRALLRFAREHRLPLLTLSEALGTSPPAPLPPNREVEHDSNP